MTDELRAKKGDWDSDFDKKKSPSSGENKNSQFKPAEYLRMDKDGTYTIRLVGSYVSFRRHFKPIKAISHDDLKEQDPAWKAGFYPRRRYAINIIDKTGVAEGEAGVLKIMEQGPQVFDVFSDYRKATGIDPSGKDGPNFSIIVEIPIDEKGIPDPLHKKYGVVALGKAPISPADKKILCKVDESGEIVKGDDGKPVSNLYPLSKIFKPSPIEKMNELWDALPDDKKIAPKRDSNKNTAAAEVVKTESETSENTISDDNLDAGGSDELFATTEGDSSELF